MPRMIDRKKRGGCLRDEEWRWIVESFTAGLVPDYQMSALLMAVWFRGLSDTETSALTRAMMESGSCLDFSTLARPTVDKHSTGGVGDKVSLALAPCAAAAGLAVPMVSGRGLGHTGGTLDKLAAIPGFRTVLTMTQFMDQVRSLGCAITGQSDDMAPADGMIYALRDVTATVDCIPLIAASIMSKKLAAGPQGIVFDVKVGRGAFMQNLDDARRLAGVLIRIGAAAGRRCTALLTNMDQPLGVAVGNALEVSEIIDLLRGGGPEDLKEITVALVAEMLITGGLIAEAGEAWVAATHALEGPALQCFSDMVEAQGGQTAIIADASLLPSAPVIRTLEAPRGGFVAQLDARVIGEIAVVLGAGRSTVHDAVDPRVGIMCDVKVGSRIGAGEALLTVHAADEASAERALRELYEAVSIVDQPVPAPPLILERIDETGATPWVHPMSVAHG
ncbi:thymidine phosphorylase [Candidatus Fermentibacteria bacterium]|nr:thymidine phosphorylase [Candidatus Fermentibacteria bacterium]